MHLPRKLSARYFIFVLQYIFVLVSNTNFTNFCPIQSPVPTTLYCRKYISLSWVQGLNNWAHLSKLGGFWVIFQKLTPIT
jgi:hypothetical protein